MRVLFVAYCMINNENGDSLIGVYKRALRVGMEMQRRGHEVWVFCTGRQDYRDELTAQADGAIHFLDFPAKLLFSKSEHLKRRYYRKAFARLKPDLVVAGEAPLAGTIMEATLCAVSLGIRVAVLDNAYNPDLARAFVQFHGPMVDGLVLTGPSSFQMREPPPYYCAAPPYINGSSTEAENMLQSAGFAGSALITVLGYERKAEQLALALLPALPVDCKAVILSPNPRECQERVDGGPASLSGRVLVLPPPGENLLFGMLSLSRLVIGKSGFMQVSECLALGTPFLGIEYRGCLHPEILHPGAARFVHGTTSVIPNRATIDSALRFLRLPRRELCDLHDGRFGAVSMVADFLEHLPIAPRRETTGESARAGYTAALLTQALASLHPDSTVCVDRVRSSRLRNLDQSTIDSIVCLYRENTIPRARFLWGRHYTTVSACKKDVETARQEHSPRRLLHVDPSQRLAIEEDAGEPVLPGITI